MTSEQQASAPGGWQTPGRPYAAPARGVPVATTSAPASSAPAPAAAPASAPHAAPAADSLTAPRAAAATAMPAPAHRPRRIAAAMQGEARGEIARPPADEQDDRAQAPLPLLRIVCWELSLVAGVLAVGRPWQEASALAGAGVLLLATTAVRVRGHWLSTLLLRRLGLLLRRRHHDLTTGDDQHAALLRLVAPGAAVGTAAIGEQAAGVLARREEMLTILRPVDTGLRAFVHSALGGNLLPAPDPAMPRLRLQLVMHRGPRGAGLPLPALKAWLAVRAMREVDLLDDDDLRVALNNTVRRVQRRLTKEGLAVTTLSEREILGTLAGLAHTGPGRRGTVREEWEHWCAGPVFQTGLRVSGLGPLGDERRDPMLERLFAAVPDVAVTVGIASAESNEQEPPTTVRLSSPSRSAVNGAADHLAEVAAASGVNVERLDGCHSRAVAATLPIGGMSP